MADPIDLALVPSLAVTAQPQVRLALDLARLDGAGLRRRLRRDAARNPFVALSPGRPDTGPDHVADPGGGLVQHALAQARLCTEPRDWSIVTAFVEALDPNGWLDRPVADIACKADVPLERAEAVLDALQTAEPTGLFARSLSDCLRLQAREQGFLDHDCTRMLDDLDGLNRLGLSAWAGGLELPRDRVVAVLARLRGLDPKPGARFGRNRAAERIPDVLIRAVDDGYAVTLNRDALGDVGLDPTADGPEGDRRAARTLAEAIAMRNRAVLKVAQALADRQDAYLRDGTLALRPLTRAALAREVGLHPSTVGRICAGLLLETPQGVIGAEQLFGSGVRQTESGAAVSNAAVRSLLSRIIDAEDPRHPLTDRMLSERLRGHGLPVARRTVQKYRKLLGLASARDRRRAAEIRDAFCTQGGARP